METFYAQVIDIPLSYIVNALLTIVGGGILWQFKTLITRIDTLDHKINVLQLDITEIKTWKKYKDREDDRDKDE